MLALNLDKTNFHRHKQADLVGDLQDASQPCCNLVPNDAYAASAAPESMYTMLSCSLPAVAVLRAAHCLNISTWLSIIVRLTPCTADTV